MNSAPAAALSVTRSLARHSNDAEVASCSKATCSRPGKTSVVRKVANVAPSRNRGGAR
ncbi:MAG: hypothetical protein ACOZQL_06600 [Myxococcota bacterium]